MHQNASINSLNELYLVEAAWRPPLIGQCIQRATPSWKSNFLYVVNVNTMRAVDRSAFKGRILPEIVVVGVVQHHNFKVKVLTENHSFFLPLFFIFSPICDQNLQHA